MRGKAPSLRERRHRHRITPAHAGKSSGCGFPQAFHHGSPPHTRGKASCIGQPDVPAGITPAYAGKRRPGAYSGPRSSDHPHTRGEKQNKVRPGIYFKGSPPHLRGKVALVDGVVTAGRITPAHAGKRFLLPSRCALPRDHPRACGEKVRRRGMKAFFEGSPPHMRGKAAPL